MGDVVAFERSRTERKDVARRHAAGDHAERVAHFCRSILLERRRPGVALDHIAISLGLEREQVVEAVECLRRAGRAETAQFALRTRPHVIVTAVSRIDDAEGRGPATGS